MAIPSRVEFDEAMLPQISRLRLKVSDPEIKEGEVELVHHTTNHGVISGPWGMEGGFAIVYKFKTKSGKLRALRCFKKPMPTDIRQRYEQIEAYFRTHINAFTAGFKYHDPGIMVQAGNQKYTSPLIEMEWVEGTTLLAKVDELCQTQDRVALGQIANQWLVLLRALRAAKIAHGDLAGNNVMVRPDGRLVLIDYDGVYIPSFAGMHAVALGQPDYQHPQVMQRAFNDQMDNFSALLIYLALLALHVRPELWQAHTQRDQGKLLNENLLFKREDFSNPKQSALFKELERLKHQDLKSLLLLFKQACQQDISQVMLPPALMDPDADKKSALVQLEQAIRSTDDERIVKAWIAILAHYPPAQVHRPRVELAEQRNKAYHQFKEALRSDDDEQITAIYDAKLLDNYARVSAPDRQRLDLARRRWSALQSYRQAVRTDDDDLIMVGYHTLLDGYPKLLHAERQRLDLARKRQAALQRWQQALKSNDDERISAAYDVIFNGSPKVLATDWQRLELAKKRQAALQQFRQSLLGCDDEVIIAAYDVILDGYPQVLATERQRLELAKKRQAALMAFRKALWGKNEPQIVAAYDPVLDNYSKILPIEWQQLEIARRCLAMPSLVRKATQADDDEMIAAVYDLALVRPFTAFTTTEQQRINLAQQRVAALQLYRQVLKLDDDIQILAAYKTILDGCRNVQTSERHRHGLAQQRSAALQRFRQALMSTDEQRIVASYDPLLNDNHNILGVERQTLELARRCVAMPALVRKTLQADDDEAIMSVYDLALVRPFTAFTTTEQQRISLAQRRRACLRSFRTALASKDEQQIVSAYDSLLDGYKVIQSAERQQLDLARRCVAMPRLVRQAIASDQDNQIIATYDPTLIRPFTKFTPDELRRINESITRIQIIGQIEQALNKQDIQRAIQIEQSIRIPIHFPQLSAAKKMLIEALDPTDLSVRLEPRKDTALLWAQWQWPQHNCIELVTIVWRTDRWPMEPEEHGANLQRVARNSYEKKAYFEHPVVGRPERLYVRVFASMKDVLVSQQEDRWLYSAGKQPTARKIAQYPYAIKWQLKKPCGSPQNELIIETTNHQQLPDLVIIKKNKVMPLSIRDGDVFRQINGNEGIHGRISIPLHVAQWPRQSILRIFAADADTILEQNGIMIQVT